MERDIELGPIKEVKLLTPEEEKEPLEQKMRDYKDDPEGHFTHLLQRPDIE